LSNWFWFYPFVDHLSINIYRIFFLFYFLINKLAWK
jgi:hypothetical protein